MPEYYLAVDIGASSGRHVLGWLEGGLLHTEEVHRFPNGLVKRDGHLCWELDRLYSEILAGLKKCKELRKVPVHMGVDTWGVDFVLLDGAGQVVGDTVGYRDSRTSGMDQKVYDLVSESELYHSTGIQKQIFNTIYQLMAVKETAPEQLAQATAFFMIPDYFHYLLTGKVAVEYTNATTTQLMNAQSNDWDCDLLEKLGYPVGMFPGIQMPGTILGGLRPELSAQLGFDVEVTLPATHDTASAVLAVPGKGSPLYISSGTWSLMGVEREAADCSPISSAHNFTSEGGYGYRYRFLKNIMGLWMLQSVRKETGGYMSFVEISQQARACGSFPSRVDVNDNRFFAPYSMIEAVREACRLTEQLVPESIGEVASVIYHSLAECYAKTAREIQDITGLPYPAIHIVGGGCQDEYLNELTARYSGKPVIAGPVEATAIGNIAAQMLGAGVFPHVEAARECISKSFPISIYQS